MPRSVAHPHAQGRRTQTQTNAPSTIKTRLRQSRNSSSHRQSSPSSLLLALRILSSSLSARALGNTQTTASEGEGGHPTNYTLTHSLHMDDPDIWHLYFPTLAFEIAREQYPLDNYVDVARRFFSSGVHSAAAGGTAPTFHVCTLV